MQRVFALLGWDGEDFRVCLMETKKMHIILPGYGEEYFEASLPLGDCCGYSGKFRGEYEGNYLLEWHDELMWQDNFTFYDPAVERYEAERHYNPIRRRIAEGRLYILGNRGSATNLFDYFWNNDPLNNPLEYMQVSREFDWSQGE